MRLLGIFMSSNRCSSAEPQLLHCYLAELKHCDPPVGSEWRVYSDHFDFIIRRRDALIIVGSLVWHQKLAEARSTPSVLSFSSYSDKNGGRCCSLGSCPCHLTGWCTCGDFLFFILIRNIFFITNLYITPMCWCFVEERSRYFMALSFVYLTLPFWTLRLTVV